MEIRRAQPEDQEAIFDLYRFAYPDWEKRIPQRWLWQFVDNPFADPKQLSIFLALDDEKRIIGQTSSIMEQMQIGSERYPTGWVVDVFVHPDYRGQGVAKALKKMQKSQKDMVEMSISMVDAMRHIVQNLGSRPLAPLQIFLLRVDPRSLSRAAARRLGGGFLGGLVQKSHLVELYGNLLNAVLDQRAHSRKQMEKNIVFQPVNRWGDDADILWEELQHDIAPAAVRNTRYLNWKYVDQPGMNFVGFMGYRDGRPVGYLILRPLPHRGVVVDLMFSPKRPDDMVAALDFAVDYFRQRGLKDVRIGSSHPVLIDCIQRAGAGRPVQKMIPMFYTTRDLDLDSLTAASWWFTLGDHDIQQ